MRARVRPSLAGAALPKFDRHGRTWDHGTSGSAHAVTGSASVRAPAGVMPPRWIHVAPMPIDCGKSGACQGWPNPCTASTRKSRQVPAASSRRLLWIIVDSFGPSRSRCYRCRPGRRIRRVVRPPEQRANVLSTSHVRMQLWFASPSPGAAIVGRPVRLSTSCVIWPTFSSSVIRWSSRDAV